MALHLIVRPEDHVVVSVGGVEIVIEASCKTRNQVTLIFNAPREAQIERYRAGVPRQQQEHANGEVQEG